MAISYSIFSSFIFCSFFVVIAAICFHGMQFTLYFCFVEALVFFSFIFLWEYEMFPMLNRRFYTH